MFAQRKNLLRIQIEPLSINFTAKYPAATAAERPLLQTLVENADTLRLEIGWLEELPRELRR